MSSARQRVRNALEFLFGWARLGRSVSWAERIVAVLMIVALVTGLTLRVRGYLFDATGFWLDEASWAMRLFTRPLVESRLRPIGFLAVSKVLAVAFSPSEMVLRALPWGAGVMAVLLSPLLARRLFTGLAARLLFVSVICLSPCAIDFSKEFKPYSVALALHIGIMLAALRYIQGAGRHALGVVLAAAAIGSLFSQDLVLAFPGLFLLLGWEAHSRSKRDLWLVVGTAGLILAGLGTQYLLMWRHLPKESSEFWGSKYDIFYTTSHTRSYIAWATDRYLDLVAMPGIRRTLWNSDYITFEQKEMLRSVDTYAWLWLHALGLWVLAVRARWREALLIVMPLVVLLIFNRAGFWPLGAFRTNVFTLAYSSAIAASALDAPGADEERWFAPVPTLVLVAAPLLFFETGWNEHKRTFTYDSTFPNVVEYLARLRKPAPPEQRDTLILDRRSCDPWLYYTQYHPKLSRTVGTTLPESYNVRCLVDDDEMRDALDAGARPGHRVWIVLHTTQPIHHLRRTGRLRMLRLVANRDLGSHTLMAFMRRR